MNSDFDEIKINSKQLNYEEIAAKCLMTKDKLIISEPVLLEIMDGLNNTPLFTESNISVIKGHSGVRKTTLISILIGSLLKKGMTYNKLRSYYKDVRPVIVIDTEQGDWHAQRTYKSILGGLDNDNFYYYTISALKSKERAKFVEYIAMKLNPCMIVIDGIRDLILNFNDIGESQELIDLILNIKSKHNCHIVNIIHLNKSDGNSKGHLGAFLQEKSETVMNVCFTDTPGYSNVICEKKRGYAPFKDFEITNMRGYGEIFTKTSHIENKQQRNNDGFWNNTEKEEDAPY